MRMKAREVTFLPKQAMMTYEERLKKRTSGQMRTMWESNILQKLGDTKLRRYTSLRERSSIKAIEET